jgi:hypothetical protein
VTNYKIKELALNFGKIGETRHCHCRMLRQVYGQLTMSRTQALCGLLVYERDYKYEKLSSIVRKMAEELDIG